MTTTFNDVSPFLQYCNETLMHLHHLGCANHNKGFKRIVYNEVC